MSFWLNLQFDVVWLSLQKYSFEDVSFKEKGKQFSFKPTNTLGLQFPKGSVSILSKQIPLFIFLKILFYYTAIS